MTRAWRHSATRSRQAPGAEAMSPTSLSSIHVHTPDATTSCRCESYSCRLKWKPLVRCGGVPSRKWLINIHRPASSNVSFPLTRRSLRSFRLYSHGFEGFGFERQAASVDHHTLDNRARSAAMTSRPPPSDTRQNTAPILPARIPEQWSPKQAPSLSA